MMAIYEITANRIEEIRETTFGMAGIKERGDLQRLLRDQIEIVSPDTLVIAEEFGEWTDSRRRIDLLGLDEDANLVVFELKRSEDGGFMELQALRYAAMVSAMTFDKVVEAYGPTPYLLIDRPKRRETIEGRKHDGTPRSTNGPSVPTDAIRRCKYDFLRVSHSRGFRCV